MVVVEHLLVLLMCSQRFWFSRVWVPFLAIVNSREYDFDDTQVNTYTFDDMDLYNIPDALFEDLAREFEPLEKGVSPITQVQGNMVCNDMHIVCAFDSDKVW